MVEETFDEFLRRTHCAQTSTDEILKSLYDARAEISRLKNKLNSDSQNFEIECLKATIVSREEVIRDLWDVCDRLMGDSDLPDDDSPEMKAMQRAAAILKGGA